MGMKRSELVERLKKQEAAARQTALRHLVGDENGRIFLWWLLQESKAIQYQPFSVDPHLTAFNCGQMDVGARILAEIVGVSPTTLPELMTLMLIREKDQQAALSQLSENDD